MSELTSRLSTTLADRYRIERQLGEGGMATVYLAEDLKHDRKVAIKVLRPELAAVLGAERFVQEIKTTAALQHPHILPLHDSGETAGFLYYVMPFIDGETLRDKLNRETQLTVEEAVKTTTEVADALDYAHRHNIIHRDVKPENILLHDGRPMVADFGIALAVSAAAGGRMTETGMSLGTPHYMSPEQATADKNLTRRSDIYSLGAVLYEMLTGEPPHTGSSAQQIVMKIVTETPEPVTSIRKAVPANVTAAVSKALEKLPADRFATVSDFAKALTDPTFRWGWHEATVGGKGTNTWRTLFLLAGTTAIIFAGLTAWALTRSRPDRGVRRYTIQPFLSEETYSRGTGRFEIALAPDGSAMALVDESFGTKPIRVKEKDETDGVFVAGSEGGYAPSLSPDGEWLAFFDRGGGLHKVPRSGGPAITITDSASRIGWSMAWLEDGSVLFTDVNRGISRVRDDGGEREIVLRAEDAGGEVFRFVTLPDARGIIYLACQTACLTRAIRVFDMHSREQRLLVDDAVSAWYASTGHLVYVQLDGGVFAAPFDLRSLEITGPALPVLDGVRTDRQFAEMQLSENGTLVYMPASTRRAEVIVQVDRLGNVRELDEDWETDEEVESPAVSPDGRLLAYATGSGAFRETWVKQLPDGPATRLTESGGMSDRPFWAPGGRVAYRVRDPSPRFAIRRADASTPAQNLLGVAGSVSLGELSRNGRYLVYSTGDVRYAYFGTDTTDYGLLTAPGVAELEPTLSPDGRWLAYASDESGGMEVYVRPFPNVADQRIQVSDHGGSSPLWAKSSTELFYVDKDGTLVAASFAVDPDFRVTRRAALFEMASRFRTEYDHRQFDVSSDGQSFYMVLRRRADGHLILVENFFEELKTKMGN